MAHTLVTTTTQHPATPLPCGCEGPGMRTWRVCVCVCVLTRNLVLYKKSPLLRLCAVRVCVCSVCGHHNSHRSPATHAGRGHPPQRHACIHAAWRGVAKGTRIQYQDWACMPSLTGVPCS